MPPELDIGALASGAGTILAVFGCIFLLAFAGLRWARIRIEALAARYADALDDAVTRSRALDDVGKLAGWVGRLALAGRSRLTVVALLGGIIGSLALGILTGQLVLSYALVGLLVGLPFLIAWILQLVERKRLRLIEESLPDAAVLIGSSLAAGLSFPAALSSVATNMKGPLATEARIASNEISAGASIGEALRGMVRRTPSNYLGLFVAAASVHVERGGNLAESLKQLGTALTRILLAEREVQAKTAGSRREMVVASAVPAVVLPIGLLLEPAMFLMLFNTLPGQIILALAAIIWAACAKGLHDVSHKEV